MWTKLFVAPDIRYCKGIWSMRVLLRYLLITRYPNLHLSSRTTHYKTKSEIKCMKRPMGLFFGWPSFFRSLNRQIAGTCSKVPAGLQPLYDRMMRQVQQLKCKDPEFCRLVLSTMTLAYRPLHLLELGILSGLPVEIVGNLDSTVKIVGKCGSFLTIREDYIYFIHQSAKDYLDSNTSEAIFP